MKKQLTMTTAMASVLMGCSSGGGWDQDVYASHDTAVCVDSQGRRVYDDYCRGSHSGGYTHYYLRHSSPVPFYGDSVRDARYAANGSFTPQGGASYASAPSEANMTRSQAVSRGGLGGRGSGFGGAHS